MYKFATGEESLKSHFSHKFNTIYESDIKRDITIFLQYNHKNAHQEYLSKIFRCAWFSSNEMQDFEDQIG